MTSAEIESIAVPEYLQGDWTSLLLLTYGADLTFFERHLLRQLPRVALRVVLADDRRLTGRSTVLP